MRKSKIRKGERERKKRRIGLLDKKMSLGEASEEAGRETRRITRDIIKADSAS